MINLFFYILQKIVKVKNIYYPEDVAQGHKMFDKKNYHNDYNNITHFVYLMINEISYYIRYKQYCNAKAKIIVCNKYLDNIFISAETKYELYNIYVKAQNIYLHMFKLMEYYKLTKYPLVVTNDLMLNPLNMLLPNTHIIIQNKRKYAFALSDLCNVIESSLGNSNMFFPEPLKPKNPYNNVVFTYCELYNIYFKMRELQVKFSTMFHLYFLSNFDTNNFVINNELYLRDYTIKCFVYKSPTNILVPSIYHMLDNNIYTRKLNIHSDFPDGLLVSIFRPFLYYYYIINYYLKTTEKYANYYYVLHQKLRAFYNFNPLFGRQIINLKKNKQNKIIEKIYEYNTKHISFHKITIEDVTVFDYL
jgi:hypothetical protein